MSIEIRQLKKEDTEIINFIINRQAEEWVCSTKEIENEYITASFSNTFPYIYIAFYDKEFAGQSFITFVHTGHLNINNEPWLNAVFVKEKFRGLGIAQKIIEVIENKCRELRYPYLYLDTVSASGYYTKLGGWEKLGTAIWETKQKEVVIMRKKL